jgi:ribosomal protein S18 acetylase RimI-like enzyme
MGLEIRPYVRGADDEVWVSIANEAWAFDPEDVPTTVERFRVHQKAPNFSVAGRFVAELDGTPVGTVNADIDPKGREDYGWLNLQVLPEHQRRGIGAVLYERACTSLLERGVSLVRTGSPEINKAGIAFITKHGFKKVRTFSLLKRPLAGLPSGIGEFPNPDIRTLGKTKEDARLLTRMSNDAFSEHYLHRDSEPDEEEFWMEHAKDIGYEDWTVVARCGGEDAGFLIYGFNSTENERLNRKEGWLFSLGVLKRFRNRGIAKALMLHCMKDLADRGMETAALGVDDTNVTHAINLYERVGFKVTRKSFTFERRLGQVESAQDD